MANNEGVDIIIKATDQYTATINKINASNELLGKTIKSVQQELNATTKLWTTLRVQGIDPASASMKVLKMNAEQLNFTLNSMKTAATGASGAITGSANNLKKSNQAYTNLALVVQDLPFGFRGIQNNLPALMGSVAGATGPMYLAFSALIAAVTAYDMGLFKAKETNDEFNKSLLKTNEELSKAVNYTNADTKNLESLIRVGLNLNNSEQVRLNALKDIKKVLGQVNKEEANKITTIESAIIPVQLYTEALKKQQLQEYASGKIAQLQIDLVEKRNALAIASKGGDRSISILKLFGINSVDELRTQVTQAETQIRFLEDILDQANKKTFTNPFDKSNKEDKVDNSAIKQQNQVNEQVLQGLIDAKKIELKIYEDDAFKKYEVAKKLAELEKQLAIEKIKNAKYTPEQIAALELEVNREFSNQMLLLDQQMQEQLLTQDAKTRKEKKRRREEELREQQKFGESQVDLIDAQLKVQLRLNRDNVLGQQEAIKESMAKIGVLMAASFGTGMFPTYLKFFDELNAKLEGMDQKALRGAEAMKQVNSIISDTATNALVQFGENLGKAFAGENVDIFGGFLDLLAGGLQAIGSALIAYGFAMDAFKKAFNDPYLAIAAGVALVAAGSFLKSKISKVSSTGGGASAGNIPAFANGGIISGPTMGLMGEYPGAKSNPEVVAPLDKLKDMLGGGGGGTFVLRGQDLLLSVNRAQKASNIKGQTISLA
jgi:hypothetical protein